MHSVQLVVLNHSFNSETDTLSKKSSAVTGLCEMKTFTIQRSRQGFIWLCSFSLLLFLLRHSGCSVAYISPLSTQSLTALVWDKADIFILPPPNLTQQGASQFSSESRSLTEKTYLFPPMCTPTHRHLKELGSRCISFSNICTVVSMTDGRSRKLFPELLSSAISSWLPGEAFA